jgi:DNA-directed RNA polymerase subunit M/transcription elongation factor TFIIS
MREKARALVGVETEAFLFAHAEDYPQSVRRVLGGETKEEALRPRQLEQILVPEGMHRCSCGCRRVSSTSIQMRRADESATVFLICSQCNKVWRN